MKINDKLISNNVFSLSKEKGFIPNKEKTGYSPKGRLFIWWHRYYDEIYKDVVPTQTTLRSWLSQNHNIFIDIQLDRTSAPKFAVEIYKYSYFGNYDRVIQKDWSLYRTYEEALEVGLLEGLKLIK